MSKNRPPTGNASGSAPADDTGALDRATAVDAASDTAKVVVSPESTRSFDQERRRPGYDQSWFLEIIGGLQEGIAVYDKNDRLVVANEEYCRLHDPVRRLIKPGMHYEDMVRAFFEGGHVAVPETMTIEQAIANRVRLHRNPGAPILRQLKNGTWFRIKESKIRGGIAVTETDVTELAHAKQALEESRQRFMDFATTGADWLWEIDAEFRFVEILADEKASIHPIKSEMIGKSRWEANGIDPSTDEIMLTRHKYLDFINVFTVPKSFVELTSNIYPGRKIRFSHQSSSLINGVISKNKPDKRDVVIHIDRFGLHILVAENKKLLFYNQYVIKRFDDYIRFIKIAANELNFDLRTDQISLYGYLGRNTPHFNELKKTMNQLVLGHRPDNLNFSYVFDEVLEHQYFDLFSTEIVRA